MAYVVGLTATDGCLYTGFRKINFKSCDRDLVETYRRLLRRTNPIKESRTRIGRTVYFLEFGDTDLYRWFESIGLTPRKSLTLGAIAVPRRFLLPLVRGLLDGDGTIYRLVHHPTPSTYPEYEYERLWTRFTSASLPHLQWLRDELSDALDVSGYLRRDPLREGKHPFFTLKYGNRDSAILLGELYRDPDWPCLARKRAIWYEYATRKGLMP